MQPISQLFTVSNGKVLWKVQPDPLQPVLALEWRDTEALGVEVETVALPTGARLAQLPVAETDWWLSLEACTDGTCYLQRYAEGDIPQPEARLAYEAASGRLLWERPVAEAPLPKAPPSATLHYPVQYVEGSAAFRTVARLIVHKTALRAVRRVCYLETTSQIITYAYVVQGQGLREYLLIFSRADGTILLQEVLAEGHAQPGDTPFFLQGRCLIALQGRYGLCGWQLPV